MTQLSKKLSLFNWYKHKQSREKNKAAKAKGKAPIVGQSMGQSTRYNPSFKGRGMNITISKLKSYILGAGAAVQTVQQNSTNWNSLTSQELAALSRQKDIEDNSTAYIDDVEERAEQAKELLCDLEETVYRLSSQCGYEAVVCVVPVRCTTVSASWLAGSRSLMAARKLMDMQFDREVYAMANAKMDFNLFPINDLYRIYKDCFESLVRQSNHLFLDFSL